MSTVSPQQWNTTDAITSSKLNTPINQLAAVINGNIDSTNISSLTGAKIQSGTLNASAMDTSTNVETRMNETLGNFVASGCVLSFTASTLNWSLSAGIIYINGKRVVVNAASGTVGASKDTYFSIDNSGVPTYTGTNAVANNAASPTLPANSIELGIAVSGASAITSVNTGQSNATAPVVSSRILTVTDSNGVLIYPTVSQKQIGYSEKRGIWNNSGTAAAPIPDLTTQVLVPAGATQKVKVHVYIPQVYSSVDSCRGDFFIYDGSSKIGGAYDRIWSTGNGGNGGKKLECETTLTAGLHTISTQIGTGVGTGVMTAYSDSTTPMYLSVEKV